MKRITVDQVLEAYAKTGLKPSKSCGSHWACEGMACGLGAFAAASIEVPQFNGHALFSWQVTFLAKKLGLQPSYVYGFVDAFDGDEKNVLDSYAWWDEREYDLGYADGQASAAAVAEDRA